MTYTEILSELDKIGVKDKFIDIFESKTRFSLLEKIKATDKIYSVGVLLIHLLKLIDDEKEKIFWRKILHYFMTPKFARKQLKIDL